MQNIKKNQLNIWLNLRFLTFFWYLNRFKIAFFLTFFTFFSSKPWDFAQFQSEGKFCHKSRTKASPLAKYMNIFVIFCIFIMTILQRTILTSKKKYSFKTTLFVILNFAIGCPNFCTQSFIKEFLSTWVDKPAGQDENLHLMTIFWFGTCEVNVWSKRVR